MSEIVNIPMNRRRFLETSLAGGSLVLGFSLSGCSAEQEQLDTTSSPSTPEPSEWDATLNAFVGIDQDGRVTLQMPFVEMGQGIYTALSMLIAEEMDIELNTVNVVQAPHGPEYRLMFGNRLRFTGGSYSVRASFQPLRQAGAAARYMLMQAAAQNWQVAIEELTTEKAHVIHKASNRKASYAELAQAASGLTPPTDIKLKKVTEFNLIGTAARRTDTIEKSTGQAWFGIDTKVDDMLVAAVKMSPVFDGTVLQYDADKVISMPGVVAVEAIPNGIAVVADNYWHAQKALDALPVEFSKPENSQVSNEQYLRKIRARLDDKGITAEDEGNVKVAFDSAVKTLEADYHTPLLAHATMEPMNCTVLVKDGKCTAWAPNQGVDKYVDVAARVTGLDPNAIDIQTPYLGGGFGRRSHPDYMEQAVTLANKLQGKAIKVMWSREEDTQHDVYRPMTAAKYRAAIDENNQLSALHITTVGDGPGRHRNPQTIGESGIDRSVIEGATERPYQIPNKRLDYVYERSPFPVGYWRSVGNSHNAFFNECFLDELALAVTKDPLTFRKELLKGQSRFLKVLDTVAEMAGWDGTPVKEVNGQKYALGLALHEAYETIVAEIAEVSLNAAGVPQVHKVYCSVDCGLVINPQIASKQIESAVAYGLSAALNEQINIENGQTTNSNFHDYPILTAQQMPKVIVNIIESQESPGGIGEAGTPPIAPAVCNALFALTGKRLRQLPIVSALNNVA